MIQHRTKDILWSHPPERHPVKTSIRGHGKRERESYLAAVARHKLDRPSLQQLCLHVTAMGTVEPGQQDTSVTFFPYPNSLKRSCQKISGGVYITPTAIHPTLIDSFVTAKKEKKERK